MQSLLVKSAQSIQTQKVHPSRPNASGRPRLLTSPRPKAFKKGTNRRHRGSNLDIDGKCKLKRHHPECKAAYTLMRSYKWKNRWYQLQGHENSAWLQDIDEELVPLLPSKCSYSLDGVSRRVTRSNSKLEHV